MSIVRKVFIAFGLVFIALFSVGCGSSVPVNTTSAGSTISPTIGGTGLNGTTASPIVTSLTNPNGVGVSAPAGGTIPTGPLGLPSSLLGGQTPWSYLNSLYPSSSNDTFAVVNVGQYTFSFGPSSSAAGGSFQYSIQLPSGVQPITNSPGCTQAATGVGVGQVQVCVTFSTVSSTPLDIQIAVNSGGTSVTQNIYVLVLPGGQLLVQNGSANQGPPPVVYNQTIYASPSNGNSSIQTIPSTFTLAAFSSNGSPASIQSMTVQPPTAAQLTPNGPVAQVTALQGGPLIFSATVIDSSGNQENITSQINIPRQLALRYTLPSTSNPCLQSSYTAFLTCGTNAQIPVLASVSSAGGPQTPFDILPGPQIQSSAHFPPIKDPQFKFLVANLTFTVAGNIPAGALQCNAMVAGGAGVIRANYTLPPF